MESGQLDERVLQEFGSLGLDPTAKLSIRSPSNASSGARTARQQTLTPTPRSLRPDRLGVLTDEDATPRPQAVDSPLSTASTCESDEDRNMDTPLDDGSFHLSSRATAPTSLQPSNLSFAITSPGNGTPPLDTLSDQPADRIGSARGLDELYESSLNDGPISTAVGGARRGSIPSVHDPRPPSQSLLLSTSSSTENANSTDSNTVPPLSRSTLLQLGSIKGITPPTLASHTSSSSSGVSGGGSIENTSVVSAGLEMGLGVGMATAALAATLPPGCSGLGNFAEPRYTRLPPLALDTWGLHNYNAHSAEKALTSVPAGDDSSTGRPVSMIAADDSSARKVRDNIDTELARRKTTGWDAGKARREISKRHRTETHDETLSHTAARNAISQQAQRSEPHGVVSFIPQRDTYYDASAPSAPGSSSFSSLDSPSTHHRASRSGSTQLDTPSLSGRAMLSPDVNPHIEARGGMFGGSRDAAAPEDERVRVARERQLRDEANGGQASFGNNGGLMGSNVGGHFGPGVRAKVIEILDPLIAAVPLSTSGEETLHLVEYGCLNSRSIPLMQLIISKFAQRGASRPQSLSSVSEESSTDEESGIAAAGDPSNLLHRHVEGQYSRINFSVIHEDSPQADFRLISQSLDSRSDSYLDPTWQSAHHPILQNTIFPSFVGRPFASRIAPPRSLHFGMSLMDLHWTHTPFNSAVPLATSAHAELVTFLKARAHEFRQGGILVVAFLARSDDRPATITPGGKKSSDIWSTLTNTLAPCIQRLVSCGMLKSDVARYLLDLPLHPRTPRQTRNALSSLRHLWEVEWSCGLGEDDGSSHKASKGSYAMGRRGSNSLATLMPSEPQTLRIAHPAWKAFTAGTLSKVAMAEHMIMLFKNLYEAHFRKVLREKGKLSKGAVEFVLDSLWDVVSSRVDDHPSNPMKEVEIEVTICALKRV